MVQGKKKTLSLFSPEKGREMNTDAIQNSNLARNDRLFNHRELNLINIFIKKNSAYANIL